MEQLILVGVIVLFSMLDAVARKKRDEAKGEVRPPAPPAGEPESRRPRPRERPVTSYDQDPSFDDAVGAGSQGVPGRGTASREGPGARAGRASSEGLIPEDVWEEIQALARGRKAPAPTPPPPAPAPVPRRAPAQAPTRTAARVPRAAPPPMSTAARKTPPPASAQGDAVGAPEHAVHLTHPKYGTPVRDRLTGFGDEEPRGRGTSTDFRALRNVLRGGGAPLRQAVLLHEILGPPVSLKEDPSAG